MNLHKIGIIISREFSIRVKKKSFIITTILTPLLFALLMFVPSLIMLYSSDAGDEKRIMVIDNTGLLGDAFVDTENIDYDMNPNGYTLDFVKQNLDTLGLFAVVDISLADSLLNVNAVSYSERQLNREMTSSVERSIEKVIRKNKLQTYDVENINEILDDASYSVSLKTMTLDKATGEAKESSVMISMVIAYISAFLIYIFIFTFGNMVMRGVIEEKATRIVEVIVSSVKPMELMVGKIMGVASVALTQFVIWIVLGALIIFGTTAMLGVDELIEHASSSSEMMSGMPGADMTNVAGLGNVAGLDNMTDLQKNLASDPEAMGVISSLADLNVGFIICSLVIYFILGYLLYSSMFAAVGSAVDNEADTQQFMMPITIPLILGLYIMLHPFEYPDSALSVWASIIPFTSPMVMMARVPFDVPMWQYLLSIGLLVVTFLGVSYVSAKIYRVGILMYGQKISWKDLAKWLKF